MAESLLVSFASLAMQTPAPAPDKTLVQYISEGGEIGYLIIMAKYDFRLEKRRFCHFTAV